MCGPKVDPACTSNQQALFKQGQTNTQGYKYILHSQARTEQLMDARRRLLKFLPPFPW